jgi:hypothetical protein
MKDYILLMHADGAAANPDQWLTYLNGVRELGVFEGGSAIGGGETVRKDGVAVATTRHISGYIRVRAADLAAGFRGWRHGRNP